MRGRARIELGVGGRLLREIGGEALVEEHDRHVERLAQPLGELLARACLLAPFAAQRQREADDDLADLFTRHEVAHLGEPRFAVCALDDADRAGDRPGRVGDRDARARGAVVECHHLHEPTSAFAACSASATPAGFLPPASASVDLPPPPPPMCFPSSRTTATASRPRSTSAWSKLTTRNARPSSTDATIAPCVFSC